MVNGFHPPTRLTFGGMTFSSLDHAGDVWNILSPTMLILRGSPALSPFRLQKLVQDLAAAGLPARAGQTRSSFTWSKRPLN